MASEYMRMGVEKILTTHGIDAEETGDGVLEINLAITGVNKSTEDFNAYQALPVGFLFTTGQVATGNRTSFVDVAMEAELKDSINSQRQIEIVQTGIGGPDIKSEIALIKK